MLLGYARIRGLKRWLLPTPVYAPHLSAYWVHLVTPVTYHAVLPLIEGLHADALAQDDLARQLFPAIHLLDFETAVRYALIKIEAGEIESSWSDALVTSAGDLQPYRFATVEGMYLERRQRLVDLPATAVFRAYTGLGGQRGWLYMDWAWSIRGWIDKIVGGVGLRRGRRHPDEIWVGESLDFWRVDALITPRAPHEKGLMRLRAEMKVPGKAWLEFESLPQEDGRTLLVTTAYFDAHGLFGFLYWYAMWPVHKFIFDGLTDQLARRARLLHNQEPA